MEQKYQELLIKNGFKVSDMISDGFKIREDMFDICQSDEANALMQATFYNERYN